jgi:hypothetical protein
MQITNNALLGGAGISILAQGAVGNLDLATVNANISNVAILNDESVVEGTGTVDDDGNSEGGETLFVSTTGVAIDSIDSAIVDVSVTDSTIGNPAQTTGMNVTNGVVINLDNDNSFNRKPNRVLLDDLELTVGFTSPVTGNVGTGVAIFTGSDTLSDIVISDSIIRPNAAPGPDDDDDGFPDPVPQFPELIGPNDGVFGDTIGNSGIVLLATGTADEIMPIPPTLGLDPNGNPLLGVGLAGPGTVAAANRVVPDIVTDGVDDNLTRLTLSNNTIRDFTFDGVDIATAGDARLLLNISGNTVANNGAGLNDDTDNDNVFGEEPPFPGEPAPTQLLFFDGINIDAFDASTISARISGNEFRDNLERGLSLNTFGDATINAIVTGNGFFGNDRGEDEDAVIPGTDMPLSTFGFADFEAINNEEFYFRSHESTVFVLAEDEFMESGESDFFDPTFVDPMTMQITGMILGDDDPRVTIPLNTGFDIFGNPIPVGQARMNIVTTGNGFQLGTDIRNFAFDPAMMMVDPTALTLGDFALTDGLIDADELLFLNRCFQ